MASLGEHGRLRAETVTVDGRRHHRGQIPRPLRLWFVTFGLKGPAADLASAAVGAGPAAFMGVREIFRQHKSRGWVTVRNKDHQPA